MLIYILLNVDSHTGKCIICFHIQTSSVYLIIRVRMLNRLPMTVDSHTVLIACDTLTISCFSCMCRAKGNNDIAILYNRLSQLIWRINSKSIKDLNMKYQLQYIPFFSLVGLSFHHQSSINYYISVVYLYNYTNANVNNAVCLFMNGQASLKHCSHVV